MSMVGASLAASLAALSSPSLPSLASRGSVLSQLITSATSRGSLDAPGVLWMEHVNLLAGPRDVTERFYCDFLGFVREPGRSWHINLGSQQLHLASAQQGGEHRLSGSMGLAVPSLAALRGRIPEAQQALAGTHFAAEDLHDCISVRCPWGNHILCYDAALSLPSESLPNLESLPKMARSHVGMDEGMSVRGGPGIRFVEFRVRPGTLPAIARFYKEGFGCHVTSSTASVLVAVGPSVHLVFTDDPQRPLTDEEEALMTAPKGDGMGLHICIYIAQFRRTYDWMKQRGLVFTNPRFVHLDRCDTWEQAAESRTFRVKSVIDLETGEPLLELEHEIRPQRHFQFMKRTHYPDGSGM